VDYEWYEECNGEVGDALWRDDKDYKHLVSTLISMRVWGFIYEYFHGG
jgi:hypothetical protein